MFAAPASSNPTSCWTVAHSSSDRASGRSTGPLEPLPLEKQREGQHFSFWFHRVFCLATEELRADNQWAENSLYSPLADLNPQRKLQNLMSGLHACLFGNPGGSVNCYCEDLSPKLLDTVNLPDFWGNPSSRRHPGIVLLQQTQTRKNEMTQAQSTTPNGVNALGRCNSKAFFLEIIKVDTKKMRSIRIRKSVTQRATKESSP